MATSKPAEARLDRSVDEESEEYKATQACMLVYV